jgi:beta-lactamase regulating signal transducer with metallopeptidase domain
VSGWLDSAVTLWAAFVSAALWQATFVSAIALGVLIPLVRRLSPSLAIAVAMIAVAKFFTPPVMRSPAAIVDRASTWLLPVPAALSIPEDWLGGLMLIHLLGMTWGLAALLFQRRRLNAARSTGEIVESGRLHDEFERCAEQLDLRKRPTLLTSPTVTTPIAIGLWRPAVLLPRSCVSSLSPEDLRIVLAHELGHHKHRDLHIETAIALAAAIWWCHPAMWLLVSKVRQLREERCDATVVRRCADAQTYCRALLKVAATTLPDAAIAMRRHGHPLARRFERLLGHREPKRWQLMSAAALVAAFAVSALPRTPHASGRSDGASTASLDERKDVRVERIRIVIE